MQKGQTFTYNQAMRDAETWLWEERHTTVGKEYTITRNVRGGGVFMFVGDEGKDWFITAKQLRAGGVL